MSFPRFGGICAGLSRRATVRGNGRSARRQQPRAFGAGQAHHPEDARVVLDHQHTRSGGRRQAAFAEKIAHLLRAVEAEGREAVAPAPVAHPQVAAAGPPPGRSGPRWPRRRGRRGRGSSAPGPPDLGPPHQDTIIVGAPPVRAPRPRVPCAGGRIRRTTRRPPGRSRPRPDCAVGQPAQHACRCTCSGRAAGRSGPVPRRDPASAAAPGGPGPAAGPAGGRRPGRRPSAQAASGLGGQRLQQVEVVAQQVGQAGGRLVAARPEDARGPPAAAPAAGGPAGCRRRCWWRPRARAGPPRPGTAAIVARPHAEQRVDDAAADGPDAAQAVGAGAPEQAHDHGLGLVVAVVAGGHGVQVRAAVQHRFEEAPPQVAAGLLEAAAAAAGQRPRVVAGDVQGHAQARRRGRRRRPASGRRPLPRRPWLRWAAARGRRRWSRQCTAASSRATESGPPESATSRPGRASRRRQARGQQIGDPRGDVGDERGVGDTAPPGQRPDDRQGKEKCW